MEVKPTAIMMTQEAHGQLKGMSALASLTMGKFLHQVVDSFEHRLDAIRKEWNIPTVSNHAYLIQLVLAYDRGHLTRGEYEEELRGLSRNYPTWRADIEN